MPQQTSFYLAMTAGVAAAGVGAVLLAVPARSTPAQTCDAPPATDADAAACELAAKLERLYLDRETGARYAAALRDSVAAGRYASLSAEQAAAAITRDLQAVSPDGHLRVFPAGGPRPGAKGPPQGAEAPALEQAGWIAPGIAYLRMTMFPHDPAVTQAAARFMAEHATARALIFDLRTHRGGGVEQMDVILPWLFAEPTRLVTMETTLAAERELGSPVEGLASMRKLDDPAMVRREHWVTPNAESSLRGAQVYLLVGPRTASAAEHFAWAMKTTRRATLVGEPTAGANHFGGEIALAGGLAAFLPVGRTFDPVTGQDWEGTGVLPDLAVAKEVALERVLVELGLSAAQARALSQSHRPTLPMDRRPRG
ncbi:S41 family peptidase [Novosphingobium soli]|uniref:S41 family peptidase n=1 Tax=Novosphingobium soli TaxID=574956 RepID=A0ABV6CXS1_9SPHN